jgi:phosphoglycolate phosphatase
MRPIRALCFDLDGTLINSGPDIVHAANLTRRAFMVPELSYERIIRYVGSGVRQLMQGVMQDLSEEEWDAASQHFLDTYHAAMTVRTHLYDGILELLIARKGMPMAVCTNKPEDMSAIILTHFDIADYFQILVGAEAKFPKKPDPQGLLHICKQLKCRPEEVAMIGDSVVDIETARAAGCMAVAVSWGFQTIEELQAAQPDLLVHHPRELVTTSCK